MNLERKLIRMKEEIDEILKTFTQSKFKRFLNNLIPFVLLLLLVSSALVCGVFLGRSIFYGYKIELVQVGFEEVQEYFVPNIWINDTNLDDYSIGELRCGYNSSSKQFYIQAHPDDIILNLTLFLFKRGYFMKYSVWVWGWPEDTDFNFVNLHTTLSFPDINSNSFNVSLSFWKLV